MTEIGKRVTGLQHIGLPTNDMPATVAFYRSLGFEIAHQANNNGEAVCFLQLAGVCIEAYESGKAAWEAVRAAGYQPRESEIQTLPFWYKGVRFFNIEGPNGETVEFGQIL